ncbi:helix-turn-helix transcriptional regulator [Brevibacterium album]|uniref:helix-turn-helix transcriptional regulator n=1 Tax=Brevibacterium album TaxID=417948 RepID=UPI00048C4FE3|nr:transcriptional regulator [Brevibacterium album]
MTASRLLGMMLELTRLPATSVDALARRFEVSARTVQRDLEALRELGVPIWTRTGPGGGVGVVGGWRSPVFGMTGPEVQALMLGEAGARGLGLRSEFATARLKMLAASVPGSGAASGGLGDAAAVHERFLLDSEEWFSDQERPEALAETAEAVRAGRRVSVRYARPGEEPAEEVSRLLDPLGLVLKTGTWYLVAAAGGSVRTYRVSRISAVTVRAERVVRPPGFSLAEHWRRSAAEFEASVLVTDVEMRIPEGSAAALLACVPGEEARRALAAAERTDAHLQLRMRMERPDIALAQLLGVPGVEVLSPLELRRGLCARGRALAERNAHTP